MWPEGAIFVRLSTNFGWLSGFPDMELLTLKRTIHSSVGCWQSAFTFGTQS
jgi:hypothetical protein